MMSPSQPQSTQRRAFTLVELMVVIAIIGILSAVLIPAVTGALRTAKEAAIRTEIDIVDQACEAYKLQYGDYPPDFSDWSSVERHFRKAFPEINDTELKLLAQFTHLNDSLQRVPLTGNADPRGQASGFSHYRQCIDPAEALVFCLGGYSSDKKKPFTGQGGPFSLITAPAASVSDYARVQYNTERDNSFIDLASGNLSLFIANDPGTSSANPCAATSAYTYSSDEFVTTISGTSVLNAFSLRAPSTSSFGEIQFLVDPFPVYSVGDGLKPLVYFNSRSYQDTFAPSTPTGGGWPTMFGTFHSLNIYLHPSGNDDFGVARPYLSTQVNTNAGGFFWAEQSRFQLISPGGDGSYGGSVAAGVATASAPNAAGVVTQYPSGTFVNFAGMPTGADKYEDPESIYGSSKPQLDNITNFSTRTLESDLP